MFMQFSLGSSPAAMDSLDSVLFGGDVGAASQVNGNPRLMFYRVLGMYVCVCMLYIYIYAYGHLFGAE